MKKFSIVCISIIFFTTTHAQKFKGLALTPPMGWNSWNKFQCDSINETVVKQVADAMISSGMKDAGYQYVVIDDCWQIARDSAGFIVVDSAKFPSGIKALADYVHSKGLKFGIYTCAGIKTCAGRPASRGHEYQDAYTYAKWGVDYLKEDWCNTDGQTAKESYTLMRDALYKAGRPIVFSLCDWGLSSPWSWASDVGNLWRTTGDIADSWDKGYGQEGHMWGGSVLMNLDMQRKLEKYAGPDHWNDPDMLEVGNGGLTVNEERAHFSLWCMLAAPLIAGNDLRNMTKEATDILTNKEMIAIDQDALGKQGYLIVDESDYQIYMKPLSNGDTAICFFNRADTTKNVTVNWSDLKIGNNFKLRDVWKHADVGTTSNTFKASISKHDVVILKLSAK